MNTYLNSFKLITILLIGFLFLATGCDGDDDTDIVPPTNDIVEYENIVLNGANEAPPVNTQATGTFNGTYNKNTKVISYNITYSGMTATAMHFHRGEVGVSGPITIGIDAPDDIYGDPTMFTSPVQGTTRPLTAAEEAELLAGMWYINLHSAQYPAGEIRGQIVE